MLCVVWNSKCQNVHVWIFKGETRIRKHTWHKVGQTETVGYRLLHCITLWNSVTTSPLFKHSQVSYSILHSDFCLGIALPKTIKTIKGRLSTESLMQKMNLFFRACCLLKCLLIETQPSAILLRWTSMWSMGSENAVSLSTSRIHLCQVLWSSQEYLIPNRCTKSEDLLNVYANSTYYTKISVHYR